MYKEKEAERSKMNVKIPTDPFGSYTGRPEDPAEKPVLDADDL